MNETGWMRYTPHVLVVTAVFAFMHIADEMAGNWDAGAAGGPMSTPTMASISLGVFTLVGMGTLWWLLTDRSWGYAMAALFGLFFLLTGGSHLVNTANMTPFRWGVVIPEVAGAAILVIQGVNGIRRNKPWKSTAAT
ncbi:MAG: hypothetical protein R3324_02985 [Halobacteriales archaeon]|nr:hypothetical protein [Halobacteriales archaeon]